MRRKIVLWEICNFVAFFYCIFASLNRQTGGLRWYEYPLGELDARGKATEPYYPMPTAEAGALYEEYAALAKRDTPDGVRVYFGGRLGEYKYINMDQAVERALKLVNEIYHSKIKGVNL